MRFKDQGHGGITTVTGLQEAMFASGIQAFDYVVWGHQRSFMSAGGALVVTKVAQGYRLTNEERSSAKEVGVFHDEASVVSKVLDMCDPRPPRTPEQNARAAAGGREATIENAAYRDELKREAAEMLAEHRRAVSAQRAGSAESPS